MCIDLLRPCFTIVEAAQFFRFSRTLLDKLIHDHRIRTVKIGKRTIVRGRALERLLDQQQAGVARRS